MDLVWKSCKGELSLQSGPALHSSWGRHKCYQKPPALPTPSSSEGLSFFGHCKYSVVAGAHVPSPVPACMDLCFRFFAPVGSWICTLIIPLLHFNFVHSLTACCCPPLQLQASKIAGDLALICTSCFTSVLLLRCISLALASLQMPILLSSFSCSAGTPFLNLTASGLTSYIYVLIKCTGLWLSWLSPRTAGMAVSAV